MRGGLMKYDGQPEGEYEDAVARYKEFMSQPRPPSEEVTTMVQGFVFDDELLDSLGEAEDGGDVLDVRAIVQGRLEDFFGDAPFGIDIHEGIEGAVGEFAEPLYTLQDELGLEDNILVDELARWMDGQDITEFVENFRRHHEMNGEMEESLEEAKAKPDFADIDKDGDKDEDMKKAAKDKEDLDEAQSPAQKAAFAKMLASKGGKKADESDETDTDDKEELDESPTMDTTQLINLMKNSGLSEEAIETKLTEWANTPDGAAEEEATSHGEPYENFAQSVNLSLKRYLDAEDMKVGLKEHKVDDIKEAYKNAKSK